MSADVLPFPSPAERALRAAEKAARQDDPVLRDADAAPLDPLLDKLIELMEAEEPSIG